jgi:hypothetical protein
VDGKRGIRGRQSVTQDLRMATAFVPVAFWIVDGFFRRIQRTFIVRMQDIAAFINSRSFTAAAASGAAFDFSLMEMRSKSGPKTSWVTVMRFRTVAALYLLMIGGSALVSVLLLQGVR